MNEQYKMIYHYNYCILSTRIHAINAKMLHTIATKTSMNIIISRGR